MCVLAFYAVFFLSMFLGACLLYTAQHKPLEHRFETEPREFLNESARN